MVEDTARTKAGLDSLYRRLVTLVVLRSGLGNPTDPAVVSEANNCLATVFPVSQLVNFQTMARIEKKTKLRQLTSLVKGLRIYNWDCGRGGAGVDHLPSILNSAAEATRNNLTSMDRIARDKGLALSTNISTSTNTFPFSLSTDLSIREAGLHRGWQECCQERH